MAVKIAADQSIRTETRRTDPWFLTKSLLELVLRSLAELQNRLGTQPGRRHFTSGRGSVGTSGGCSKIDIEFPLRSEGKLIAYDDVEDTPLKRAIICNPRASFRKLT
jgi:hypothetical protein